MSCISFIAKSIPFCSFISFMFLIRSSNSKCIFFKRIFCRQNISIAFILSSYRNSYTDISFKEGKIINAACVVTVKISPLCMAISFTVTFSKLCYQLFYNHYFSKLCLIFLFLRTGLIFASVLPTTEYVMCFDNKSSLITFYLLDLVLKAE